MKAILTSLACLLLTVHTVAAGAPSRHLWLLTATNVPGVPGMQTPETQYGVQVFCGSANTDVAGWRVTVRVAGADGAPLTFTQDLMRTAVADRGYSDVAVFWIGPNPSFLVNNVQVTDIVGVRQ